VGFGSGLQRKATEAEKTRLVERQRRLATQVEALRPSKRRETLRRELAELEKLLAQLGYRRLG
jgi:hypothetical protein